MSFESEVVSQVYRMRELHEHFSNGLYEEMNALYFR